VFWLVLVHYVNLGIAMFINFNLRETGVSNNIIDVYLYLGYNGNND